MYIYTHPGVAQLAFLPRIPLGSFRTRPVLSIIYIAQRGGQTYGEYVVGSSRAAMPGTARQKDEHASRMLPPPPAACRKPHACASENRVGGEYLI